MPRRGRTRASRRGRGFAVVGQERVQGHLAGLVCELARWRRRTAAEPRASARPSRRRARAAELRESTRPVSRAGFVPTNAAVRFIGRSLRPACELPPGRAAAGSARRHGRLLGVRESSSSRSTSIRLTRRSPRRVRKVAALAARADEVVVLADRARRRACCRRTAACAGSGLRRGRSAPCATPSALVAELRDRSRSRWSRTCARSTRCSRRRSSRPCACRCCSGTRTGAPTPSLRLAERLVHAHRSASTALVPARSRKVRAIGHGIDLDEFPCQPPDARPAARSAGGRARPLLPGEGARRGAARACGSRSTRGSTPARPATGPALDARRSGYRRELEALVARPGYGGVRLGRRADPARASCRRSRAADVVASTTCAPVAPTRSSTRRAASCVPAIASNPSRSTRCFDRGSSRRCAFERDRPERAVARLALGALAALGRRVSGTSLGRELPGAPWSAAAVARAVRTWADADRGEDCP